MSYLKQHIKSFLFKPLMIDSHWFKSIAYLGNIMPSLKFHRQKLGLSCDFFKHKNNCIFTFCQIILMNMKFRMFSQ